MAKNLSKSGISTTQTIEAWHVTQSIDAFTGADAYNINLSGSLEVTGSSKLSGSVTLNDITYPTSDGTQFTVLRTDGAGNTIFDYADRVYLEVRSDEALTKGDPIYITGFNNGQNRITVAKADAADSNKMPAIGLVWENVGINTNTQVATVGSLDDVNTQTAPNDFQEGDVLYVKAGGGLTNVKPTGSALIQNVGKVGRRNTNNGQIVVFSIGRSNDIPNISPGYFWVGNSDSVATAVPTSSISVTPPTLQQVTDQGSSTTTAITASIISASSTVFISSSLLDPAAHVLTVDTSSGQVFYTPFEISSSGGGNVIGNPLKPLKLDGSTVTVQSTGVIDAKATQTNFKNTSGTTLASIDHTTGDAHFGLSSVDIKGNGEISSSKQLITSDGPDVEDLLMILSPPSANFDDTGSAAVNVNLSGSISASNAYALKLTSPDNNTFGIKADGSILSGDVSGSGVSTASFGTYLGDGSQLTGIETDPFPYTGSAIISGSLDVTGSLAVLNDVTTFNSANGFNVYNSQLITLGTLGNTIEIDLNADDIKLDFNGVTPSVGDVLVAKDTSGRTKFTASSAVGSAFPFTGDAQLTGSLLISGSTPTITFDGGINIQQPSAATDGIRIGYNAQIYETGAPQYNIAIGHTAKDGPSSGTDYDQSIAIGRLSIGGDNSIAIGGQATAAGYDASVVVGDQSSITGNNGTVIGALSTAAGSGVSIGRNADSNKQGSITIGTNTTNNQDDSIVLNATSQVVTHGVDDSFAVYMTDATTPDFQIEHDGTSFMTGIGKFEFRNTGGIVSTGSLTVSGSVVDFTDATAISGSTFSGSFVGDGSQLTNLPNTPTSQSIYYTADTPDQDIFNDGKIYIKLNDAATDDIQAEVLTNPSSGDVTFTWESAGASPTSGGTALNTGDAITTLNGNFGDYDKMSLTVYAPGDTSYPYYEFLFTKGASGTNFATRYNKWDSLP